MKRILLIFVVLAAFGLTACGNVGPFRETMYIIEEEPAPELAVDEYFSPEEMEQESQYVEYFKGHAGFEVFLPADWHYEIVEWSEEAPEFGIDFWPGGSGDGRLRLRCYGGSFGVCGTGLTETEGELPGTGKLRVGCYDGREYPSFIGFHDSPGGWALLNELCSGWNAHWDEIEKILGSLVLDPGAMRVSEAEETALAEYDAYHDYLQTDFDTENGNITVKFVRMGGKLQGQVVFEKCADGYLVIKPE